MELFDGNFNTFVEHPTGLKESLKFLLQDSNRIITIGENGSAMASYDGGITWEPQLSSLEGAPEKIFNQAGTNLGLKDGVIYRLQFTEMLSLDIAGKTKFGGIKVGENLNVEADGTLNVPIATVDAPGVIKPDGTTITVDKDTGVATAAAGEPQEQADWNETDNTKPDFIKNKPDIPAADTALLSAGQNIELFQNNIKFSKKLGSVPPHDVVKIVKDKAIFLQDKIFIGKDIVTDETLVTTTELDGTIADFTALYFNVFAVVDDKIAVWNGNAKIALLQFFY